MNVEHVITFLGGTAVLIAAVAWLTREFVKHLLDKDRKLFEHDMKAESARSLKELELRMKEQSDKAIAELQKNYQLEIASTNRAADAELARNERIRGEIVRWANPILGAVRDLRSRLVNILRDDAQLALQKQPRHPVPAGWSISYEYFMPSTLYLFCHYFYWVKRFQAELNFELFRSQADMDALLARLQAVRHHLGTWPMEPKCSGKDAQVFALQQRAMGEALTVRSELERAMGYDEFMAQWEKQPLALHLSPLRALLEDLDNDGACRWKRLEAVLKALEELEGYCGSVLQPLASPPVPTGAAVSGGVTP